MKNETEPLERIHVMLYASDVRWLRETCRDTIGVARAVRKIIRTAILNVEAKTKANPVKVEVDLDL